MMTCFLENISKGKYLGKSKIKPKKKTVGTRYVTLPVRSGNMDTKDDRKKGNLLRLSRATTTLFFKEKEKKERMAVRRITKTKN